MRVLFIATFGVWTPHLETELELASKHIEDGDDVTWVICDDALDICDANLSHDRYRCANCRFRVEAALRLLPGPVETLRLSKLLDGDARRRIAELPERFETLDELKAFEFDGFDAGWAALSSAIWEKRGPDVDTRGEIVRRFVRAGVASYLATRRLLKGNGGRAFDRVYVFNGRMAPKRGVLRAAQQLGVPCFVHERGRDLEHYALYENCMPHDIEPTAPRVNAKWESSTLSVTERETIAREWFESRAAGQSGAWTSYTREQEPGALPENWDPSRRNAVFFSTTEYEFASIGKEWHSDLFDGPTDAIVRTAAALSERGRVHLTIRVHPNPTCAKSESVMTLLNLRLPGVSVVAPEDTVSTYALLRAADVVVTSGSTAGIEATFWGRPSVLAGRGLYSGLQATYEPATHEELYRCIEDTSLGPIDPSSTLRYGFYQATLGHRFQHFEPNGLFDGTYDGNQIEPTRMQRKIARFLRHIDRRFPRIPN